MTDITAGYWKEAAVYLEQEIIKIKKRLNVIEAEDITDIKEKLSRFEADYPLKKANDYLKNDKPSTKGRDKFVYKKCYYDKRNLARAVIKDIVRERCITTYDRFNEIFPASLNKHTNVIREIELVMKRKSLPIHYYMDAEDQIELDGKTYVITKEWKSEAFPDFLEIAKRQGIEIRKVTKRN